jgi:hypothetical protein
MLGDDRRLLKEIDLIEISVVEEPADLGAKVNDVKSALDAAETLKDIEALLREAAGFSKTDATALVARIKSMAHREDDADGMHQQQPLPDDVKGAFWMFRTA